MSERILALDPGERTGWAAGTWDGENLTDITQGVAALKDMATALGKRMDTYDTVIYETWRLRPDMTKKMIGNDFQPSQLIGMIRYIAWQNPQVKLVSQTPTQKKTGFKIMQSDVKDRLARSSEQHDQDALAHLCFYVWKDRMNGITKQTGKAA